MEALLFHLGTVHLHSLAIIATTCRWHWIQASLSPGQQDQVTYSSQKQKNYTMEEALVSISSPSRTSIMNRWPYLKALVSGQEKRWFDERADHSTFQRSSPWRCAYQSCHH